MLIAEIMMKGSSLDFNSPLVHDISIGTSFGTSIATVEWSKRKVRRGYRDVCNLGISEILSLSMYM